MKVPGIAIYDPPRGLATTPVRQRPRRPEQGVPSFAAQEDHYNSQIAGLDEYVRACWEEAHPQEMAWRVSSIFGVRISTRQIWAAHYRNQALDRNRNERAD